MKLEDFVKQNREAFDDKDAPEKVWSTLESSLPQRRASWWSSVGLWRAAAILFMIISIGLSLSHIRAAEPGTETNQPSPDVVSLNEFRAVEDFYFRQISDKVKLIDEYNRLEGLNGITQDFHQLEAMYLVLRDELKKRPSKEVKDALELNLLVRINLLNQQLYKLEKEYGDKDRDKRDSDEA